jgi:hypothetical protein
MEMLIASNTWHSASVTLVVSWWCRKVFRWKSCSGLVLNGETKRVYKRDHRRRQCDLVRPSKFTSHSIKAYLSLLISIISRDFQTNTRASNLKMAFQAAKLPKSLLGYHRLLAPTAGVKVSPLCLGGMSFGDAWYGPRVISVNYFWHHSRKDLMGECPKEKAFELLDYFHSQGGNFVDTYAILSPLHETR